MPMLHRVVLLLALGLTTSFWSRSGTASEPTPPQEAHHESLPAVDGLNAKFSVFGSEADVSNMRGAAGSVAVPIDERFGFQLDGAFAEGSGIDGIDARVFGVGGHLFWRDPGTALVGGYGHFVHADTFIDIDLFAFGFETELYLDRFSLGFLAGVEGGNKGIDTDFVGVAKIAYYPTDNLQLSLAHSHHFGLHNTSIEAEYGLGVGANMAALFGVLSLSGSGEHFLAGGVRVYFGSVEKALINRHREDDPSLVSPLGVKPHLVDISTITCSTDVDSIFSGPSRDPGRFAVLNPCRVP